MKGYIDIENSHYHNSELPDYSGEEDYFENENK